jgi:hypothetical protein
VVQSKCESPPGQICFGQWTPAGVGRSKGVYFGCRCVPRATTEPPRRPCELVLDTSGAFKCSGECANGECRLAYWRDPNSGRYVLGCRCAALTLETEP